MPAEPEVRPEEVTPAAEEDYEEAYAQESESDGEKEQPKE